MFIKQVNLSLDHWRYQLLHWFYGVENNGVEPSYGVPRCFYTHYCPLFHATNLMVLGIVFIAIWKLMAVVVRGLVAGVGLLLEFYDEWRTNRIVRKWSALSTEERRLKEVEKDRKWLRRFLSQEGREFFFDNFELFYRRIQSDMIVMTEEEVQIEFLALVKELRPSKEEAAAKMARRNELAAFWIQISSQLFKALATAFYVALGVGSIYAVWAWVVPAAVFLAGLVWDLGKLTMEVELASVASVMVKIFFGFVGLAFLFHFINKGVMKTVLSAIWKPFAIVGSGIVSGVEYGGDRCSAFGEFVSELYENNCPPIVLSTKNPPAEKE
jgi:hypothetical protein